MRPTGRVARLGISNDSEEGNEDKHELLMIRDSLGHSALPTMDMGKYDMHFHNPPTYGNPGETRSESQQNLMMVLLQNEKDNLARHISFCIP
jgi:hypothetical protein